MQQSTLDTLNAFKCESTWIEVKDNLGADVIVGVCYKCPAVSEQELKEMFNAISQASKGRCLIVGDFNYPNINLDNWECNKDDEEFVDLLQDNVLHQHVDTSTRVNIYLIWLLPTRFLW